jgi:hypothetical protein
MDVEIVQDLRPLAWYEKIAQKSHFVIDVAQRHAITVLDGLWQAIINYEKKNKSLLRRIGFISKTIPQSIYLWGGVGRGKSFLMNAFFQCLPISNKKRIHFHAFMAEVHQKMREYKHHQDPLTTIAKKFASNYRVLCFDEFHVSDIADAMILGRLLESMLAHHMVIVATSNFPPNKLYEQGLNRSSFLPTIALLEKCFHIVNVDGGVDYRQTYPDQAEFFLKGLDADQEKHLNELFIKVSEGEVAVDPCFTILGHTVQAKKSSDNAIWFGFEELCCQPRSQRDYLELAKCYSYVFISGVKKLNANQQQEARRLTWLFDIFYDCHVKVAMTMETSPEKLYTEGPFAEEFVRTASRMREMQSKAYLDLPHLQMK